MEVTVLSSPNSRPQGKRGTSLGFRLGITQHHHSQWFAKPKHNSHGADCKNENAYPDLVIAQPDAALCNAEAEYMVSEGLALGVPLGRGKRLCQHLLQQLVVWLLIKSLHMHSAALLRS